MRNFKEYITNDTVPSDTKTLPTRPEVPLFSDKDTVPEQLIDMTSIGTPLFIHPEQTIRNSSGKPIGLTFVSALGIVDAPDTQAKTYMTDYDKVSDFVRQLSDVDSVKTDTGFRATWTISMGMSVISLGIEYTLEYDWVDDRAIVFHDVSGDLDHVYGSQEWIPYKENKTLYFFTTAHEIGEGASYLAQLGNLIPNREIAIGVMVGGLGVEKHIKWLNEQLKKNEPIKEES